LPVGKPPAGNLSFSIMDRGKATQGDVMEQSDEKLRELIRTHRELALRLAAWQRHMDDHRKLLARLVVLMRRLSFLEFAK